MELEFLGTGAGMPNKERNVSSIVLDLSNELKSMWMFDCGEGTQHQILHSTIKPRKINKILITHLHGDHIYGLPGFLSSRSFLGGTSPLTIYGPSGIKEFVQTALQISCTHLTYDLHYQEIEDGLIFSDDNFTITAKQLHHGIPSYGFRIEQQPIQGKLLVDKLRNHNILPGPIYKEIKEQTHVTLPDGTIVATAPFISEPQQGKKIAIFGDTRVDDTNIELAHEVDVLVHESTFAKDKSTLARDYFHSTTTEVATFCLQANVKKLILTHISSRYQKEEIPQLLEEARSIFSHTEIANDGTRFSI
ncbi:ribonuclease Z [Gracilibacillus marinus]|uniref:Ribonuclease Z n=1 Tax=Gracilibacillus marinus TaxID=630535 RepID=A0ABV8VVP7_9BACI